VAKEAQIGVDISVASGYAPHRLNEPRRPDIKLSASSRAIPTIRVKLTPQGPRVARPICRCQHEAHLIADVAMQSEGGANHFSGAACQYVVKSWDDSTLVCAACDKAAHSGRAAS
jgi:hypothetical protein